MSDVSAILTELNDHGFEDTETARKLSHINAAYYEVLQRYPWPFLKTEAACSTDGTTGAVTLPSNYGRPLWMRLGDRYIPEISAEEFYRSGLGSIHGGLSGVPVRYFYQLNGILYVWPKPGGTLSIPLGYVKRPTALVEGTVEGSILIPNVYHRLLVAGALQRLYRMEDDPELSQAFKAEFEELLNNMANDYMVHPAETPRMEGGESDSRSDSGGGA